MIAVRKTRDEQMTASRRVDGVQDLRLTEQRVGG
jgi:hypothetical protein